MAVSPTKRDGTPRGRRGARRTPAAPPASTLPAASAALARALYGAVAYTSFTPLSADVVRVRLAMVAEQIVAALLAPDYQAATAREAGAAIVALQFMQPEALGRMQAALFSWLLATIPQAQLASLSERSARVAGDVAAGFGTAARDAILAQQEQTRAALLTAEHRLQQAEDARAAAEAMVHVRTEVLHAAAHDLRSPVTSIMGHAELLQRQLARDPLPPPGRMTAHVTAILTGTHRIRAMIEELLDAARVQAGQALDLLMEVIDVGDLVQGVVSARPAGAGGDRRLAVHAPQGLIVEGDRSRLERVLENVIDNALKYSGDATLVQIEVGQLGEVITVSVQDQGVGIPPEELSQLFRPFYRASTATGVPGIGIGLAGAKAIVEQHGGRISVESTVGVGTRVTIMLPRTPHT
jgi:signal transduction histidine kinase